MKKILMIFLLSVLFLCTACTPRNINSDRRLHAVNNEETLRAIIKKGNNSQSGKYDNSVSPLPAPSENADLVNEAKGEPTTDSFSKTNTQVEGVDEGDIIKTDGKRIYIVSYQSFSVIKVKNGHMEEIYRLDYENKYAMELYLTDKYAIVLGASHQTNFYGRFSAVQSQVIVQIFDITTDEIKLEKELMISGFYNTSRLIDDKVYVVTNYNVFQHDVDLRPTFTIDGKTSKPSYRDIYYIGGLETSTYIIFSTIVLEDKITIHNDNYLGYNWGQFYINKNSIYISSTSYKNVMGEYYTETNVVRYQINHQGNFVEYKGNLSVKGYIVNQFSMDEYDDHFRIVTTDERFLFGRKVTNRLYIFKIDEEEQSGFKQVGELSKGLGKPLETVKSVRFNQTTVSVVTFQQTDPLYLIDLSDPQDPVILSALEIPGFSTYQHIWDDNTIIGIGYDTIGSTIQGMKVSLFDTTDKNNVKEVAVVKIEGYSEALHNHKSILIDKDHGLMGFSVSSWRLSLDSCYSYPIEKYYLFKIDLKSEDPLTIVAVITHNNDLESEDIGYYYFQNIKRVIYIGDYYYAISNRKITSHYFNEGQLEMVEEYKIQDYQNSSESFYRWLMLD